jgi:hypothetical protein
MQKSKGKTYYFGTEPQEAPGKWLKQEEAVYAIMGHAEDANDLSAVYTEEPIEDDRPKAVTDFVRAWLFSKPKQRTSGNGRSAGQSQY